MRLIKTQRNVVVYINSQLQDNNLKRETCGHTTTGACILIGALAVNQINNYALINRHSSLQDDITKTFFKPILYQFRFLEHLLYKMRNSG